MTGPQQTPEPSAAFNARLEELRRGYAKGLPDEIALIRQCWGLARTLPSFDPLILKPLRTHVHNLAGSGATYGYDRLSRLMQDIEQKIDLLADFPEDAGRIVLELDALLAEVDTTSVPSGEQKNWAELDIHRPRKRPDKLKVLLALAKDSPSSGLDEQLLHYGMEIRVCDPEALAERLVEFHPDILLFEEDAESNRICPSLRNLFDQAQSQSDNDKMGYSEKGIPDIFILNNQPSIATRVRAFRNGAREVLFNPPEISALLAKIDDCFLEQVGGAIHVLIIDDDKELAQFHANVLEQAGFKVEIAHTAAELEQKLGNFSVDVILMDLHMPDYNGIELSAALRQDPSLYGVPIIFISVEQDIVRHLGAIKVGGDDFLIKPVAVPYLIASVETRARRGRELRSLIRKDGLTGLFNHVSIEDSLQQMLARAIRSKTDLSVAMIDLDYFKKVNDNYGHLVGDRVLIDFARFLKGRLRKSDVVGRFGGEEFMLILPDTSVEHGRALLESIRQSFSIVNHNTAATPVRVTFSAGVACHPDFSTASTLIKAADTAMYQAKEQGRNRVITASRETLQTEGGNGE